MLYQARKIYFLQTKRKTREGKSFKKQRFMYNMFWLESVAWWKYTFSFVCFVLYGLKAHPSAKWCLV